MGREKIIQRLLVSGGRISVTLPLVFVVVPDLVVADAALPEDFVVPKGFVTPCCTPSVFALV